MTLSTNLAFGENYDLGARRTQSWYAGDFNVDNYKHNPPAGRTYLFPDFCALNQVLNRVGSQLEMDPSHFVSPSNEALELPFSSYC
ncbi:hypothetical protein PanWU01x14_299580 [Parasponia andersonii]|uniref:Uncharacterized protein n=1 Tax=Parasponia andersonii TaxID=3476 RepID=A0A2P5AU79_PARAD|nr:hypothetical protein PanWU01x14_299580 [Parasponia andersonii]